jgi:hypothetical protein
MEKHPKVTVVGTWTPEHERRLQLVAWQIAQRIARERRQREEQERKGIKK